MSPGSFAGMESMLTTKVIDQLQTELRAELQQCARLRELPLELLHKRPAAKRWSSMEVLRHIQLSSGHYHKRLKKLYDGDGRSLRYAERYTSGRWGDYSAKAMDPRSDGSIGWRMKTMAMFEPRNVGTSGWTALEDVESMLNDMVAMLEKARTMGLEGKKVTSTLGPILRFQPGDAFRFPIAHQKRHFLQIENTLKALQ